MVALQLGIIKIYWYGIFYLISFVLGYAFLQIIKKKNLFFSNKSLFTLLQNNIEDVLFRIILGVVLGGRIGYVLFYDFSFFVHDPIKIFYVWQGGMSFVGGTLGVILSMIWVMYKYGLKKVDFLRIMDIIVSILPVGIMLGRLGNLLNQELYGKTMSQLGVSLNDTLLSIMMNLKILYVYTSVDNNLRINSNLFESFFEGFVLLVILQILFWKYVSTDKFRPGLIATLFVILYGIIRFIMEYLRYYPVSDYIYGLTLSQYFMIGFVVIGLILWALITKDKI